MGNKESGSPARVLGLGLEQRSPLGFVSSYVCFFVCFFTWELCWGLALNSVRHWFSFLCLFFFPIGQCVGVWLRTAHVIGLGFLCTFVSLSIFSLGKYVGVWLRTAYVIGFSLYVSLSTFNLGSVLEVLFLCLSIFHLGSVLPFGFEQHT